MILSVKTEVLGDKSVQCDFVLHKCLTSASTAARDSPPDPQQGPTLITRSGRIRIKFSEIEVEN
jgi:hypothetical protein